MGLKFGDRCLELGLRRGDVRELDDVRGRFEAKFAEVGQIIVLLSELGQNATGEGDVARLDLDTCRLGEGLHDGQQ